eukprot:scaffold93626_cov25-Tisochrysis_lutea.AAC.2
MSASESSVPKRSRQTCCNDCWASRACSTARSSCLSLQDAPPSVPAGFRRGGAPAQDEDDLSPPLATCEKHATPSRVHVLVSLPAEAYGLSSRSKRALSRAASSAVGLVSSERPVSPMRWPSRRFAPEERAAGCIMKPRPAASRSDCFGTALGPQPLTSPSAGGSSPLSLLSEPLSSRVWQSVA